MILLISGVQLIFRSSPSDWGDGFLGIVVTASFFQTVGQHSLWKQALIVSVSGMDNMSAYLLTCSGKMSPRSSPLGFLQLLNLLQTSSWVTDIAVYIPFGGRSSGVSLLNALDIEQKKSATCSAAAT